MPSLICEYQRPWLESWLAHRGLHREEIGSWAIHPGGSRIVETIAESLELGDEQLSASRAVFSANGNMSSPTVLFIVKHLREKTAPLPCVALAFGPGLIAESALIEH